MQNEPSGFESEGACRGTAEDSAPRPIRATSSREKAGRLTGSDLLRVSVSPAQRVVNPFPLQVVVTPVKWIPQSSDSHRNLSLPQRLCVSSSSPFLSCVPSSLQRQAQVEPAHSKSESHGAPERPQRKRNKMRLPSCAGCLKIPIALGGGMPDSTAR